MRWLLLLLLIPACDTPETFFRWKWQGDITVGKNEFTVFYNETAAQTLRHNRIRFRDIKQVEKDALVAIEKVTGCAPVPNTYLGDPALIKVRLRCKK